MFNLDRFGRFITDARLNASLTQKDVAEKLSISPQAVSQSERGETFPHVDMLTAISSLYSVPLDALIRSAELNDRED